MNDALQDARNAAATLRDQYKTSTIVEFAMCAYSFENEPPRPTIRIHVVDKACVDQMGSVEEAVAAIHEKLKPENRLKEADELEARAKAIRAEVEAAAEAQTVAA